MQRNAWNDIANWRTDSFFKVATPCLGDHQFKEDEIGYVGQLSKVCSQIVPKCLYLRRFYWDLNGKEYRIGNVCLFIGNKDDSYRSMWMTSKWLERSRMWLPCGRNC